MVNVENTLDKGGWTGVVVRRNNDTRTLGYYPQLMNTAKMGILGGHTFW
jgi:hypothetical protein